MGQKYKSEGKEILYALRCAGARALYKKRSERRLLPDFLHQVRRMVSPKPPIGFPTPPIGISTPPIEISKPPIENTTPPIEKSKPPIEKRSPGPRRKLGRKPAMKPPFFAKHSPFCGHILLHSAFKLSEAGAANGRKSGRKD